SSLINSLIAHGTKAPVSSQPGWTRDQTAYQLPRLNAFLLDTPGVMHPGLIEPAQGLKLAVCGLVACAAILRPNSNQLSLRSHLRPKVVPGGVTLLADYLIYLLQSRPTAVEALRRQYAIPETTVVTDWME